MSKTTVAYWNPLATASRLRWSAVGGPAARAEALTLSTDPVSGEYTRLTRFQAGADTSADGPRSHDYPEEVFIVSGRLHDHAQGLWLEPGHYASRPPGEVHGPFSTDTGCLVLEVSCPGRAAVSAQAATDLYALELLHRQTVHHHVTRDAASHAATLHAEFRALDPEGHHRDRNEHLRHWAAAFDPVLTPYWDLRDERIAVFGDTALVAGTHRWERHTPGGGLLVGMTACTHTYVRCGGRWLCVLMQSTPVDPQSWPGEASVVVRYVRGRKQLEVCNHGSI